MIETILILLIIINVVLMGFFGWVIFLRYRTERDYVKKIAEIIAVPERAIVDVEERLKILLEEAVNKAESMIKNTEELRINLAENINRTIQDVTNNYERTLADTTTKAISDMIHKFKEIDKQDIFSIKKYIEARVDQEINSIRVELDKYKFEQINKMREKLGAAIVKSIQEIIGEKITPQQEENVVLECLTRAKKENVFGL